MLSSIVDLHSTVVLLKAELVAFLNNLIENLHSTVVLLKDLPFFLGTSQYANLHSTVVLLKAIEMAGEQYKKKGFTFYCSSIKSHQKQWAFGMTTKFTFYCSSIKRMQQDMNLMNQITIYILL